MLLTAPSRGDEPVALHWGQPGDGFGGLGDLLVDPVQRPAGSVGARYW
jgi:hypothetical protein